MGEINGLIYKPDRDTLCKGCIWGKKQSEQLIVCMLPACVYKPDVSEAEGTHRGYIVYTDRILGKKEVITFIPCKKNKSDGKNNK